ncbi:MAG TPA: BlaI/MecI/CopY family transcriptional regulator, partial [Acidobacteriota bacterium]|nr:BlaI/MecI/CopY family transcriptional regulator [Acidobacteriota bacterium]
MRLTEAEWELMKVIWRENPISARRVLEAVRQEKDWAYSTVKTMLDRLVEKGFLATPRCKAMPLSIVPFSARK